MVSLIIICLTGISQPCAGITIFVPGDYPTIQQAINAAGVGDIIYVLSTSSPYNENITMKESVNVIGFGTPEIVGQGTGFAVIFENQATSTKLEGMVISFNGYGRGMEVINSSPIIKNCTFRDINSGIENGAGALIIGDSNPVFENCEFKNNTAYSGGGLKIQDVSEGENPIYMGTPAPEFRDCVFRNNQSAHFMGGALAITCFNDNHNKTQPCFERCQFIDNRDASYYGGGGALYLGGVHNPVFTECVFVGNGYANADIIHGECAGGTFTYCTFAKNAGRPGMSGEVLHINRCWGQCPGWCSAGVVVVQNCLFAFNENSAAIDSSSAHRYDVNNSDFYGNKYDDDYWLSHGTNNINVDPLFCDFSNNDLGLYSTSQCAERHSGVGTIGAIDVQCSAISSVTAYRIKGANQDQLTGETYAITCPAGDEDWIMFQIYFHPEAVVDEIQPDRVTVGQPYLNYVVFYSTPYADSTANSQNGYMTTVTVKYIGGCGLDAVSIILDGLPEGPISMINVKSPDYVWAQESGSYGAVDLNDWSEFSKTYLKCEGVDPEYNKCFDFDYDTTTNHCVDLVDLAFISRHYLHYY
jgi:hypothetical protein